MTVDMQKVRMFATLAHKDQFRKYTGEPYVEHCFRVHNILFEYGLRNDVALAASILHDTLEDTLTTEADLVSNFGENVAQLVVQLTNPYVDPKIPRFRRAYLNQERLLCQSLHAKLIKLADTFDNARSIVPHDPKFARVWCAEKLSLWLNPQMYQWEIIPAKLYNDTLNLLIAGLHK